MSTDLPTGTVTFLFTDIEGSTRLLQELGEAYRDVQDRHQEILLKAIRTEDGVEVRTEGDSIFAVFQTPARAVRAAVAAQRGLATADWPHDRPVRVRMGVHTGEGVLGGGDYIGIDVNRAARIGAAGYGGQVLLSDATRTLVEHALPQGVTIRDLGSHRLKDIEHPERLHDLMIAGLPADFPRLRTSETPTNLPVQRSSFVGREREVLEVAALLVESRLVTLTGPGGTGKTRLALRVAEREVDRFEDGVFLVDLSAVVDPHLVPSAVATALSVREEPGRPLLDTLVDQVRDRRLLLVVDNMEQVIEAASMVDRLLDAAAELRVLATSRAPLRLSGEYEYAVRPLPLPDRPELEAVSTCESVMLFVQRAGAVRSGLRLTEDNAPAISGIVERLDGLPLAIELAASRIKALAPDELLERLDRRLPLLTGGTRDAPARQRTLRAAIEWSHDLLEPEIRRLFARLAAFAGGWTLPAAEAVCGPRLHIDVLDGLTALVDHSLVRRGSGSPARFRMLETIRELASERLEASGEADEIRRRHAWHVVATVEAAEPQLLRGRAALDLLESEHDNIRAALRWSIDTAEAEVGLRLVGSLWRFWQLRSHLAEGRQATEAVLALPTARPRTAARAKALNALGSLAYYMRDLEHVSGAYEESLAIAREIEDPRSLAEGAYNLAFVRLLAEDGRAAEKLFEEAAERYREIGDDFSVTHARDGVALVASLEGDFDRAERLLGENLRSFIAAEDMWGIALTSGQLTLISLARGDLERARASAIRSLEAGEALGAHMFNAVAIQGLAAVAVSSGEIERGLRLAGFADLLRELAGGEAPAALVGIQDPRDLVKDVLPPERIEALVEEGRWMEVSEGLAYAREEG